MKRYLPNILLAAATSIFFYHGAQAYISASGSSAKAEQLEQVNAYQRQYLEQDAREERTAGTARCGIGGLMLLLSAVDAFQKRKEKEEELEERL